MRETWTRFAALIVLTMGLESEASEAAKDMVPSMILGSSRLPVEGEFPSLVGATDRITARDSGTITLA